MNVTFMIGNGFDLNLGLKTAYEHFYPYYIENYPYALIAQRIPKFDDEKFKNWSDLELALGEILSEIDYEEKDKFLDSKFEMENCLIDYLKAQREKASFDDIEKASKMLKNNLSTFYNDFDEHEKKKFLDEKSKTSELHMSFITYNYTDIFDRLLSGKNENYPTVDISAKSVLSELSVDSLIHIHGTLDGNMVFGVNDSSQIKNEKFKADDEFCSLFIKKDVLSELDKASLADAQKTIDNSNYVCLFGVSVGYTDTCWWQSLMEWLAGSENNRLVYYVKCDPNIKNVAWKNVQHNRKRKNHLLQFIDKVPDELKDRIIIVCNSEIFDLPVKVSDDSESIKMVFDKDYYLKRTEKSRQKAKENPSYENKRVLLLSLNDLGEASFKEYDLEGAKNAYNEALELARQNAKSKPSSESGRNLFKCLMNVGDIAGKEYDSKTAESCYNEALEKARQNVKNDPSYNSNCDLSEILVNMGRRLCNKDNATAEKYYSEALDIRRQNLNIRSSYESQRDLASVLDDIGAFERVYVGDSAKAKIYLSEAVEIRRLNVKNYPSYESSRDLASSLVNMGYAAKAENNIDEAKDYYSEALEISRQNAETYPSFESKDKLAEILLAIGHLLEENNKTVSKKYYSEAIKIAEQNAKDYPSYESRDSLYSSYWYLADLYDDWEKYKEAKKYYEKSLEIAKQDVDAPKYWSSRSYYNFISDLLKEVEKHI